MTRSHSLRAVVQICLSWMPEPRHPLCARPNSAHLRWRFGWLKAQFVYRPRWALLAALGLSPRVNFGERVSIQGHVWVRGPGHIAIGDDCLFDSKVTLFTHAPGARLTIGPGCYVNGTRFGCSEAITIGPDCLLADARLMDTDFHAVARDRMSPQAQVKTAPVVISENVWISAGAGVLKGVTIGRDAVIGFQSVVVSDVPAGRIFAGHPARDVGSVPLKSDSTGHPGVV